MMTRITNRSKTGCNTLGTRILTPYIVRSLTIGLFLAVVGAKTAQAESFYDSCAYDFKQHANDYAGRSQWTPVGYSAANIGRPFCPWQIVDITDALKRTVSATGAWAGVAPTSPAQCNGATYSWVLARQVSGTLYTVVGSGTMRAGWSSTPNPYGFPPCSWSKITSSGTSIIYNSPYNSYRLLLRAWEPNGTERVAAGVFAIDPPIIE
jgi:hypothetical protein